MKTRIVLAILVLALATLACGGDAYFVITFNDGSSIETSGNCKFVKNSVMCYDSFTSITPTRVYNNVKTVETFYR